jgi:hypothetical protein
MRSVASAGHSSVAMCNLIDMSKRKRNLLAAGGLALIGTVALGGLPSAASTRSAQARVAAASPPHRLSARRLRPRARAVRPGTKLRQSQLFGVRVFANANVGFALAGAGQAQYPALSTDGGRTWRIDGPQFHVDAADAPEAVASVGVAGPRRLFAWGSSVVDVTTDGGRTWYETFLGELVMSAVPGPGNELIAYVQQSVHNGSNSPAVTWQYVSRDGGRRWTYSRALGGI